MPTENTDNLREELEAAFTESAAPAPEQSQAPESAEPPAESYAPAPEGETAEQKAQREYVRDETGKFAPKDSQNQAVLDAKTPQNDQKQPQEGIKAAPKANQPPESAPVGEVKVKDPTERAPQSWKPEEREFWKDIPQAARAAIARHDQLVQQTMRESAEAKRYAGEIQRTIAPFEHLIKAEGSSPAAAIDHLLTTAAKLRTSTAPELAQLVSGMIQQFGVGRFGNSFISQLDSALSGQVPQVAPEVQAIQQQVQAELAPLRQWQQQQQMMQQQMMHQSSQVASEEVAKFAEQAEFLDDVRLQMADILDMGERNGVKYTLQQAYDIACRAHPEINRVLEQRERAKIAQSMNQTAQKARSAAVGIGGAPALGGSNEQAGESIRDSIMFAMNQSVR